MHWSLKESRYGFPHHAMTMQIFNEWFINLKYSNPVYIPSNTKEYCRLLQTNGPEYVITDNLHIEQTRPIIICLENFNSQYKIHKKINIKTDTEIMIFRKINE